MKLNRTANEIDREARNNENENWNRLEKLSKEINDLVLESGGDSNLEVVQARGGEPVLNDRLNKIEQELAETAKKTYVDFELNKKASKRELEQGLAPKADQSFVDAQFASIVSGAPKGTFTNLQALKDAYPNGEEGIFLVLSDGNWYYWNEEENDWLAGGLYQAVSWEAYMTEQNEEWVI